MNSFLKKKCFYTQKLAYDFKKFKDTPLPQSLSLKPWTKNPQLNTLKLEGEHLTKVKAVLRKMRVLRNAKLC